MDDRQNGNNGGLKLTVLIIAIISLFVLLGVAVVVYFTYGDGNVPIMSSNLKYLFLGLIILLPLLLLFLILATLANIKLKVKPDYFGVDFKKMDRERPKLENIDNYNPGEAKYSGPAPVRQQAAAAAASGIMASSFFMCFL